MAEIPRKVVLLSDLDVPWMTPFLKHLIDQRWHAYRSQHWTNYHFLKKKIKQAIVDAKTAFVTKKSRSVREMWSYVKFERGYPSNDLSSIVNNGQVQSKESLNVINELLCSFMNPSSSIPVFEDLDDDSWMPTVDVVHVWKALSRVSLKATGSDNIPCLLYKKAALVLAEPIHHLITQCFKQRSFPSLWKLADVVPLPKPGKTGIGNLRPISLLPVPAKMAEKFILINMKAHLAQFFGPNQFGIRKSSSTTHAVITAHEMLTRHADDRRKGAALLICFDFSKAFDKVSHHALLNRMHDFGLPNGFLHLMQNYLCNRQQRVRYNGIWSDPKPVTSGVPQGSLLGPYLFGLFVSPFVPIDPGFTNTLKYVDDICMIFGIQSNDYATDITRVQAELDNLERWASSNELTLNADKTTGLVRYRGEFKSICPVESLLPGVDFRTSVRLLGVLFDTNLGWRSHINMVEKKCSQRIFILRRIRSFVSQNDFLIIYNGIIRSLLEYASPVFVGLGASDARRLQRIQNRCLKIAKIPSSSVENLNARRVKLSMALLKSVPKQSTVIKDFLPSRLPSGRFSIPFCQSSLRRKSFFPTITIMDSSCHCD